jgi:hypothetical protein
MRRFALPRSCFGHQPPPSSLFRYPCCTRLARASSANVPSRARFCFHAANGCCGKRAAPPRRRHRGRDEGSHWSAWLRRSAKIRILHQLPLVKSARVLTPDVKSSHARRRSANYSGFRACTLIIPMQQHGTFPVIRLLMYPANLGPENVSGCATTATSNCACSYQ